VGLFAIFRRPALLGMVVLLGTSIAACSSDSSDTSDTSDTTKASAPAVDRQAMRAGTVRASDFPPGWRDTGRQPSSSSDAETERLAEQIPECREFLEQRDEEKGRPKAESNEFVNAAEAAVDPDQASTTSNEVVAFGSAAQAKAAYDAFAGSSTTACLQQLFDELLQREVAASLEPGQPEPMVTSEVDRLGVPAAGDATTAYQVVVTVQDADETAQIGFIAQVVRLGRYIVDYTATLFSPPPEQFGENIVARSMARFEAALGA
jgi:hypothetical protein